MRDRIPEIIQKKGERVPPVRRAASDDEFRRLLAEKLIEEANEFLANPSSEELADIIEVARALRSAYDDRHDVSLEAAVRMKRITRGGFENRVVMTIEED